ncbi:MAG: dienelactone hydrolase family protein [Chloroflexota bacterium]
MAVQEQLIDVATTGGGPMAVSVHHPEGEGKHPAVIVIMEAFGLNPNIRGIGARLAAEGFVTAAPDLYHRSGRMNYAAYDKLAERRAELRKGFDENSIITDLEATLAQLRSDPRVSGPIGIVGFCLGGRVSLLGAEHVRDISAAVIFYGGGMMAVTAETAKGWNAAADDVARIHCPILGFFGNEDQNPAPADVDKLDAAMTKAGVQHSFNRYDGAGHGFMCDDRGSYRPEAAADAWKKTVAFFRQHLG